MVARIGNDMEFANPKILWLLVVIPLWVAYYVWRSLQGGASIVISSTDSLRKAPRTVRYYLRHLPAVLRVGVLSLIIVALARPQTIEQNVKTNVEGIDIVLAMDISGSMLLVACHYLYPGLELERHDFLAHGATTSGDWRTQGIRCLQSCHHQTGVGRKPGTHRGRWHRGTAHCLPDYRHMQPMDSRSVR